MRTALLLLTLALACPPAVASPTSDVQDAQAALEAGDHAAAARLLRGAMAEPDKVKDRVRPLGFALLGEALLAEAAAASQSGEPVQRVRDLTLQAMSAGHSAAGVVGAPDDADSRGRAVVDRARAELWSQALQQAQSDHPNRATWWIDGLEKLEGESLESLALRATVLARTGKRARALTAFDAATSTADQEETEIRTPRFGLTYAEAARALLPEEPTEAEIAASIQVLERGLAWHIRATTALDDRHDFDLRTVRRALESDRLRLLMQLPARRTEALYALEAVLRDNQGNLALLLELTPWLEAHFPTRALEAYQQAQQTTPNDPRLPRLAGYLLARMAGETQAQIGSASADAKPGLRLRRTSQLRDALAQLERAYALDSDNAEVAWHLVSVCRDLGDRPAAEKWRSRAKAMTER